MPPPSLPSQITLIFGNQGYSIEQTAQKLIDKVLEDSPRDFALHRFDAGDLLKPGSAGIAGESIGDFEEACITVPFLCERYVVRLDRLELVKTSGKAARAISESLKAMILYRVVFEGRTVWALEDDLLPSEPRKGQSLASDWVSEITPHPGGGVMLELTDSNPEFLVSKGGSRHILSLKGFLQASLKGRLLFADDEAAQQSATWAASASGRLHQLLESLVQKPPPGCWLVLTASAGREKDLSSPLLKMVKKHGKIEKFITYDDYQPVDWVIRESRGKGLNLNKNTANLLIHLVGNDLGNLAGEVEKLSLLFPAGSAPTEEALMETLHDNSRFSHFWIAERMGHKDLENALSALEKFLAETHHEHPILIGILARHFRQLYLTHCLKQAGATDSELASQLKLHPFIAKKVAAQARRFTEKELEGILKMLARIDLSLKRHSRLTPVIFKDLILQVCRDGFRAPKHDLGLPT